MAVSDSGPGIDSTRIKDLFEPFERLGAESGPAPGSGIGLALSQRIAQQAGRGCRSSSELGRGAKFTVALEAAAERDPVGLVLHSSPSGLPSGVRTRPSPSVFALSPTEKQ